MRVSTIKSDRGYKNYDPSMKYEVTVNGIRLVNGVTADEENGVAESIESDENGKVIVHRGGFTKTFGHKGKVLIRVTPRQP